MVSIEYSKALLQVLEVNLAYREYLASIRLACFHNDSTVFGYNEDQTKKLEFSVAQTEENNCLQQNLINAYRRYGYLAADLDPLGLKKPLKVPELAPEMYGLDNETVVKTDNKEVKVFDLVEHLKRLYCGPITAEFMHLIVRNVDTEERHWFASNYEKLQQVTYTTEQKRKFADLMLRCQNFDHFLALKFPTTKRYGGEGAEAMLVFLSELFDRAPIFGIEDIILCIAHRGRLNLLVELMKFPVVQMFRKVANMRGLIEFPESVQGSGDVLMHLSTFLFLTTEGERRIVSRILLKSTALARRNFETTLSNNVFSASSFDHEANGGKVHISMLPNPSHLEAINPAAVGRSRAKAASKRIGDYGGQQSRSGDGVLCVQIHGDGAFTGQGVIWETASLSQTPHFRIGGSIHFVTNNQIAYTAEAHIGRSSVNCTDLAKAIDSPVIHVNGNYPEEVAKAAQLALDYRDKFRKDIFINYLCYRRWGHNEMDDPRFTQPVMYKVIDNRKSVPDQYADALIEQNIMKQDERENILKQQSDRLTNEFRAVNSALPEAKHLKGRWTGMIQAPHSLETWDTGVSRDLLRYIGAKSVTLPKNFVVNSHLQKMHVEARLKKMESGSNIEWGTAEALAFGSLLLQGYDIRISGEDVGRGTFSQRHVVLVDQDTDLANIPLNNLVPNQKNFLEVANSILSEEAVLGYEFGFSIESPRRLCIWEAQFGDFFNGAQIMIDTLLASAESKWLTQTGLLLILPHGIDGMGPEHSSCRMERFLQLCDSREEQNPPDGESVNLRIAYPTTSAQYFHLLRRQVLPPYRKPLVMVGPKVLLRHPMVRFLVNMAKQVPQAASTLADMDEGTYFKPVITDDGVPAKKVVFLTGKHCYTLMKAREERNIDDVVFVRLESLCPFPVEALREALLKYPNAQQYVWSQEEARNSGAWSFVRPRFYNALGIQLKYCGRPELAWNATAIGSIHEAEGKKVIDDTFAA
ncbi:unnamed protein product [Enterobius vermicularis]|uniref:Transket_pyr domain-containing protein n=1 Tax=Enterobius vermicularis TaxID=51028 RepID=A0A0N4VGI6_ENTVE|nr:unnamed protein product [Enterobius vermicularis]